MKKLISIFYSLISEDKVDGVQTLKMHGPFIHSRPHEDSASFVFELDDFKSERRFLSKFLRERYSNRISIFHYLPVDDSLISLSCSSCNEQQSFTELYGPKWVCSSCNADNEVDNYDDINLRARQSGMMEAQVYFEKKFEQMNENYTICNRVRKRKK